jgi:hypothetical protein
MEEARKVDLRPLLAVGATVAVVAVMLLWAAGAFAAGGSSSNDRTPSALIQAGEDGHAREDCPEGRRGSGGAGPSDGNGAPEGNPGGSGSSDL